MKNWHRVAGVYTGSELILYIDGNEVSRIECDGQIAASDYPIELGRNSQHTDRLAGAILGGARAWRRALSPEEIKLEHSLRSNLGELALDVDFNATEVRLTDDLYLGYGGNFGPIDVPSDQNFCMNGVVDAWRNPHPGAFEIKKCYENIKIVRPEEAGSDFTKFIVKNGWFFRDLSNVQVVCTLTEDGVGIASQTFRFGENGVANPGPQSEAPFEVAALLPGVDEEAADAANAADGVQAQTLDALLKEKVRPGYEYFLNVDFQLKEGEALLPKGTILTSEQFRLPVSPAGESAELAAKKADRAVDTEPFDMECDFWRAPTDNDRGNNMAQRLGVWRNAGPDMVWSDPVLGEADGLPTATWSGKGKAIDVKCDWVETTLADHSVKVSVTVEKGEGTPDFPRVGSLLSIPSEYDQIVYYGRGPQENYWERNTGAMVGRYATTVDQMFTAYSEPGEFGYRTDCRWVEVTNAEGNGWRFTALDANGTTTSAETAATLCFSAKRCLNRDLESVEHNWMIPQRDFITLNLDYKQMGVGGDDAWGAREYPQFRLTANKYTFAYLITPIGKN